MREAVIVSTARTPIGKAYCGSFNHTQAQTLGGHAIAAAVARSGIDPAEIDDVIMGAAMQQGATGGNIARQSALRAGLPVSVAGMRRAHAKGGCIGQVVALDDGDAGEILGQDPRTEQSRNAAANDDGVAGLIVGLSCRDIHTLLLLANQVGDSL